MARNLSKLMLTYNTTGNYTRMKWDHVFIRLVKQASSSRYALRDEYNKLGMYAFSTSINGGLKDSEKQQGCGTPKNTKAEQAKKLQQKTPAGKLENEDQGMRHPYQEKEPLQPHPGGVNPETGEIGGPRGPEPTRYGDWERKGRVTDF